jgi:hypothetical protein
MIQIYQLIFVFALPTHTRTYMYDLDAFCIESKGLTFRFGLQVAAAAAEALLDAGGALEAMISSVKSWFGL